MSELRFVLALVGTIAIAIVVAGLFMYWVMANTCDAQWFEFGHRFSVWEGCMVEYEGTWYPEEVVRAVIEP